MAVLTPGSMKNRISFYRESFTVSSGGEKIKVVSLVKQDVGAEFKYIGTPSAGASEDKIQEQRTGKIKAEIRCRYFKGVKFEDLVYFEGGKFRIYSIQYEGRHEVLKLRAELRDDDTFFGLPNEDYEFITAYDSDHTRTSADFKVIENAPFPKQSGGNYVFGSAATLTIGDGAASQESSSITSVQERFPYTVAGDLAIPADGKIRSYTSAWYNMYPSNASPYARVEVGGVSLFSGTNILLGAGTASATTDADGNKFYKATTENWSDVENAQYGTPYGDTQGFLYYRLTPIGPLANYLSTLNARDNENSVTRTAGGSVYSEYGHPVTITNESLSFPTDITARTFRQGGQLSGRISTSSQEDILTSFSKEKPKTGNVRVTDSTGGLRISVINLAVVTKVDGTTEDVAATFEVASESGPAGISFAASQTLSADHKGGSITFNVDFSPNTTTGAHSENTASATGVDLTYKLI